MVAGISRIFRSRPPYAVDDLVHVDVMYSSRLSHDYKRIVLCKEILHALDQEQERARTREAVEKLIHEMVMPKDLSISFPGLSDRTGLVNALRALLPRDALHDLRQLHANGKIGAEDVAALAQIPEPFARHALTDGWWEMVDVY